MADVKKEIQSQLDKMTGIIMDHKLDELLNLYTDDCKVLPPGAEMIVGKEALKVFMSAMAAFFDKMGKIENNLQEVCSMGDAATAVSTGAIYGKDEKLIEKSKSITIWKKVNGNWHIYSSCWNSDKQMIPPQ